LEVMVDQWEHHKLMMSMIRDILMYMDKTYCKQQKKTPVYDLGLQLFRDNVVRSGTVNQRLKKLLLNNVKAERSGEAIDKVVMKNCLAMLVEVNVTSTDVYQDEFERDFLTQTRTFYQTESQEFMAENTVPDYLKRIETRLRQEEARADQYLDKSSKPKLRAVVQEELISKYAKRLVEDEKTGAGAMFGRNLVEDLARMYSLFVRDPTTLEHLREAMSALVRDTGTNIVKDKENIKNPMLFVQQVLDVRAKFHNFVQLSFKQDRNFARALKEALEYFINLDSRAAQYLSLYIDDMLKTKLKGVSEIDIDKRLNNVISIFRYLQDKDVFEDFYKQHLAGRLLAGPISEDVEKNMIAKLKAECGHQFTSRLEGMFRDMDLSKTTMRQYKEHEAKTGSAVAGAPELSVTVLTTGFWPIGAAPDCNLPKAASIETEKFTNYYTHLHSGRRLTWQTSLGTAELRCKFEKGPRELLVHTYQMAILMMFNHANIYTVADIQKSTGIPEAELHRHLLSLAHPQVQILKKSPNNRSMAPEHKFLYNQKYENKSLRVKVPLMSQKAGDSKEKEVPASVLEARKARVEAAIVRVMKSRKTLDHSQLVAEVLKQLASRFTVEPAFIKKRVEHLIDKEYLERDKEDRKVYHYLA
jgi:cullin 3